MSRNLDLTALRSFAMVAETGGVTRAAGFLNLTQSAVSMQLKRLEEALDLQLLDRSSRSISLTAAGEQLLGYAKRMLDMNDEVWGRLTADEFEGEIVLGVPHDIIYPSVPLILRRLACEFPRMKIRMTAAPTIRLKEMFGRGECDAIVTTEDQPGPGGEVLVRLPLVWIGAEGGNAWRETPLPLAFCSACIFRSGVLRRLEAVDRTWELAAESDHESAVEAMVSADLAIAASIDGFLPRQTAPVEHNGALPELGETRIILYMEKSEDPVKQVLREVIRSTYRGIARDSGRARLTA